MEVRETLGEIRLPDTRHPMHRADEHGPPLFGQQRGLELLQFLLAPDEAPGGPGREWNRTRPKPPRESAILRARIETVVVVPVTALGPAPEPQIVAARAARLIERGLDDMAGVRPLVAAMSFVEAPRRRLARGPIRVVPGLDLLLVQMAAQEEVHVVREPPMAVALVGEVAERVVDEGEAEARQALAPGIGCQPPHLIRGEEQLAAVVVIAREPRGVETHDMDVERLARKPECLAVAQEWVRRLPGRDEFIASQLRGHPLPVGFLPGEQLFP